LLQVDFDPVSQYCPTRRNLEHNAFNLVSRLAALTERLLQLIGRDHTAFVDTKAECVSVREVFVEARHELDKHRLAHGC
jgi:hypothetical protein